MKSAAETLSSYFDPEDAQWMQHAQSLGHSLTTIFDSVTDAALKLLSAASGAGEIAHTPEAVVNAIDLMFQHISTWSTTLPGIASGVGTGLNQLATHINSFLGQLDEMIVKAQNAGHVPSGAEAAGDIAQRPRAVDALLAAHGITARQYLGDQTLSQVFHGNEENYDPWMWEGIGGFDKLQIGAGAGDGGMGDVVTAKYGPVAPSMQNLLRMIESRTRGKLLDRWPVHRPVRDVGHHPASHRRQRG